MFVTPMAAQAAAGKRACPRRGDDSSAGRGGIAGRVAGTAENAGQAASDRCHAAWQRWQSWRLGRAARRPAIEGKRLAVAALAQRREIVAARPFDGGVGIAEAERVHAL